MNRHLYLDNKRYVFETMYEYFALNKNIMPLRDYINYACFNDLQGHETIDELYAANYFMWLKLYRLHEFAISSDYVKVIDEIINYLEGNETDEIIKDDIEELKNIKKYVLENRETEKLDFISAMYKMDSKVRMDSKPVFNRYGKSHHAVDLKAVNKILYSSELNISEKFLCLATYFKICMYSEIQINSQFIDYLNDFFHKVSVEDIIVSFKTINEDNIKDYIGFLKRCKNLNVQMKKDEFLNILEQKNIKYNAGNYVDRIEIGNIFIAMNTTTANDIIIPKWNIMMAEDKVYYIIAQFDRRHDAYKYFLENYC
jgi:hypothetical protein